MYDIESDRQHGDLVTDLSAVDVAVSPAEKFREFLATKNLRMTRERETILDEVFASHEHFDAEQLIQRLSQRGDSKRVSRSTIYRSLKQLEEAGLIRKVARQDDRDIYEHDYGYPQHDHFICNKCGSLTEFHNEQVSEIVERLSRELGFRMQGHRLEVFGLCDACCRPPKTRPKKLNLL